MLVNTAPHVALSKKITAPPPCGDTLVRLADRLPARLEAVRRETESRNAFIAYDADRAYREDRTTVTDHSRVAIV
jgi:hypothetical protein